MFFAFSIFLFYTRTSFWFGFFVIEINDFFFNKGTLSTYFQLGTTIAFLVFDIMDYVYSEQHSFNDEPVN